MSNLRVFSVLSLLLCINSFSLKADSRLNEYRVLHYDLFFDFKFKNLEELRAEAVLEVYFLQSVSQVRLDIKSYDITSVDIPGHQSSFSYNDSALNIQSSSAFQAGDTIQLKIHYEGSTHRESAGFGGFFFRPPYAYNIGVAFNEIPHNFGRVWYPCLDFFTSRSSYTTRTLTYGGDVSVSAGELVLDSIVGGDTLYREWYMRDPIPTYLHSLVVAPYKSIEWQHQGLTRSFPVTLFALEADTTRLRASFVDLDSAIRYFEESYFDFVWQRVGYSVLPMTGGAMEHACNIAYPRFAVNGTTEFESLMAHELAHSWWGNLVTCDDAAEMWLNEGMASFSEYLFLEKRYGWERAIEELQSVQYNVLRNAHINEGGYRSVAAMEEPYIYGTHVYRKGSLVAWALRTYLDEDYESIMHQFFADNQFKSINSNYLQAELERISGKSFAHFFDSWVFEPGFVDFFVEHMQFNAQTATAFPKLTQVQTGTNKMYQSVPLEITYLFDDFSRISQEVTDLSGNAALSLPEAPKHVIINASNKLPLACTWDEEIIRQNGAASLSRVDFDLTLSELTDSLWFRVEQHWSQAPITLQNAVDLKVRTAPNRHWRILSMGDEQANRTALFRFDGRGGVGLDPDLFGIQEDSLVLLYKPLYSGEWEVYSDYQLNQLGNAEDAFGIITISNLSDGNYCLGIKDQSVGKFENDIAIEPVLFPNPNTNKLQISGLSEAYDHYRIFDLKGSPLKSGVLSGSNTEIITKDLPPASYILQIESKTDLLRKKFIVQ